MEEVRMALGNTRNTSCKAAGVDQVGPELLKADMEETTNRLHKLFNKLWETETWPDLWKQGLIIIMYYGNVCCMSVCYGYIYCMSVHYIVLWRYL